MVTPIVIKNKELNPEISSNVRSMLGHRSIRTMFAGSQAGLLGIGILVTQNPKVTPLGAVTLMSYKMGSHEIQKATRKTQEAIAKSSTFDSAGKHKVEEVRKTHPFGFVNRRGDLVLVPNTHFQRALAKAQGTFLKHVVPGRYRIHLQGEKS